MPIKKVAMGWKKNKPDHRDFLFVPKPEIKDAIPTGVDLRPLMPVVYDQGRIGSCSAMAIAAAIQYDRLKTKQKPNFVPSRLFIYYLERAIEGTVPYDCGAYIRDGMKAVVKQGVLPESAWAYDDTPPSTEGGTWPSRARAGKRPPSSVLQQAVNCRAVTYQSVNQTLLGIKSALSSGLPVVFGFTVFDSFFDSSTGEPRTVVPMPSGDDYEIGGHASLIVGFDDSLHRFIVRNSWGTGVQDYGYFYMPYGYVTNTDWCSDFWIISRMKS